MGERRIRPAPDAWRQTLLDAILGAGDNLQGVSEWLGRNAAYIHQYVYKGSPQALGEVEREKLSRRYNLPLKDIMPPSWVSAMLQDTPASGAIAKGHREQPEGIMTPTHRLIRRIMKLPLSYEERVAIALEVLESCPEGQLPADPRLGSKTS